ncbi:MAG: hypothetical protein ACI4J0_10890 [Huintestinicola sp.]|uniref:hypothetical protein n=1 Tax=Huintestinicola sp. TaxID=2981661 RepID=UPI003F0731BF
MKKLRTVTENEVILSFLQGELGSRRFGKDMEAAINKLGISKDIITNGSILSDEENLLRKDLLGEYRGYPDSGIFTNFPHITEWIYAEFSENDLDNIRYIDYSYWNELSDGTSRPCAAARNILRGKEVFGVSNQNFLDAAESLKTASFPPVILITCNDKYLAIEGHLRLTAYAMVPDKFSGTHGYIGYCSEADMKKKEPKMVL